MRTGKNSKTGVFSAGEGRIQSSCFLIPKEWESGTRIKEGYVLKIGRMKMTTLKFFEGKSPEQAKGEMEVKKRERISEEINRLKNDIVQDGHLWDMRCWYKYKDEKGIRKWIKNGCEPNNCGNVVYCINELVNKHGFTVEQIIRLIMKNPHKEYERRIVPCFKHPDVCTRYLEHNGNYSECE